MIFKFTSRLIIILKIKNNKLENMYKELNDKYNNLASVFNEVIDKIAWWIPIKKFRENFKNKFKIVI